MKKVVKISEKKLINFIKKSLNEYNNKMINKTNIVLNEQDNNDEWTQVDDEREFDSLKEQGIFEFKKVSLQNVGEDTTFLMIDGIWTQTKKALEFDAICKDDMKALKENQNRGVRLVLRNTKGDDLLADGTKQDAFRTWLYTIISEIDK